VINLRKHMRILAAGATALALTSGGVAVAQSNSAPSKSVAAREVAASNSAPNARQSAALTTFSLSNSVSFDIQGPGGRSAEVVANPSGSPFFKYTPSGWTQVLRVGPGHYCLNGASFNYPANVSIQFQNTSVFGHVEYDSFGSGCSGVGVYTWNQS
jgi:hypothetical protein